MIKVFGVPSCEQIKKTRTFLDQNSITYTFVNIRKEPIDRETFDAAAAQIELDILLNRRGMLYRKLGLKDKNLSDEQLIEELFNEQGMIKRPLIQNENRFHVGYDEQAIRTFLGISE